MAERVLGPTGSRRRRRFLFVPILIVSAAALMFVAGAQAVHDQNFQLDGDVSASTTTNVGGTTQNLDWDSLINADGSLKALPAGFTASSFDRDFLTNANGSFNTADTTTFATGSKDTLPISPGWQCSFSNNVNSKIDIMNAYAAAYTAANGDELLYFALEKNANEGNNNVGFWFLQDEAACASASGNNAFVGDHTDGDLLIVSAFTNGGLVSTIDVYRWNGGATGSLGTTPVAHGADCSTEPAGDDACATVNGPADGVGGTITTPWLTANKDDGVGHSLRQAEFFEGGVNLTDNNLGGKCFTTFIADTRSSQSLTATLFDFSRGQLGACVTELTTTPANSGGTPLTDSDGDLLPDIAIGTGSAGVDVRDSADLNVIGADTWSGTLHFFLCGPIATGTCDTGGLEIGAGTAVNQDTVMPVLSGSAHLTSVGRYCWRGFFDSATEGVGDQTDSSLGECFEVLPVRPTLTTSAGPDVILGNPITDNAPLSGTAFRPGTNGPNATYPSINATMVTPADGTITFTLFGPNNCTSVPTGFVPVVVTVNGDGTYTASFTPTQIGEFTWVAVYSGDSPNTLGAGPTACPDANEAVIVTGVSALATAQDWLPNDTATITGPTNLNGTLTFQLYTGDNCGVTSGAAVAGQSYSFTLTNVPSPAIRSTSNTTFKVTAANEGAYSWLVHYDDTILTDPADRCETSTVSITD